ncbi:potassium/proton antiporter [Hyphococcus flavus]|uniref:Potassium/proton antiporter n=1 Tax=Hyphococcus flavus TaxID=1866326 RepID=A0AAE9ZDJ1_9PROT|nr:potassium/proton antiporter [Hyphococcus flavus]WDI31625.1 potassium/proton antiporter [Hyphococcus flavus]
MLDAINATILIGASLVVLSVLTSLVSQRIGAPLLLVFLAIGLLAGEDGLLGIEFDSDASAYFVGSLALAIILFDSGFHTPFKSYRQAAAPALGLATLGVILTAGGVGTAAHFLFNLPWIESLMLGSIVASTDAAAVFFLLRVGGLNLRDRVKSTLEIESGANDPMAIFLTASLVELAAARGDGSAAFSLSFFATFVAQIGLGVILGVIGGVAIATLLNRLRGIDAGLYPIAGLAAALVVFSITGLVGGSGFLAAYVAGLIAGNRKIAFSHRLKRFQIGMTWLAQIGMFLTLGLLATPSEFGSVMLPAVALAFVLIFLARPIAVWLCLAPFKFKWREILFVGWVGLRGAVSILLAILPGLGGVTGDNIFFNIVFMMVIASLLVQGWTIGISARLLNMNAPHEPGLVDRLELELPGKAELELIGYRIHPESAIAKGQRVPRWARPSIIIRDDRALSVHKAGRLVADDRVYLFATAGQADILDTIYARAADTEDMRRLSDFFIDGNAKISDLRSFYGLDQIADETDASVAELFEKAFGGEADLGDRLTFLHMDLIVTRLDEHGGVEKAGLIIDPVKRVREKFSERAAAYIRNKLRAVRYKLRQKQSS